MYSFLYIDPVYCGVLAHLHSPPFLLSPPEDDELFLGELRIV